MSKKQSKPTAEQSARYARGVEIARLLRDRLDKSDPTLEHGARTAIKRSVTRLAKLAKTRRLKSHAETFRRAINALEKMFERRDYSADRETRFRLASLLRLLEGETPAARPRHATKGRPKARGSFTLRANADGPLARSLGLGKGDTFTASRPATDPRPGQIIVLVGKGKPGGWNAGRFVRFETFTDDETGADSPGITLDFAAGADREAGEWIVPLFEWTPYHFDDGTIRHAATPHADEIAELRRQLRRLDFAPEHEACRRQLEKQIERLERERTTDTGDEWAGFDLLID